MRFITRTAAAIALSMFGSADPVFAQAGAPVAATAAAPVAASPPAQRSIMLQAPANPKADLANAASADNDESDSNVQQLEGVTVQGKRDAFSKSDQHMKDLINGLPCTGCDTKGKKLNEHRSFGERSAKFIAEQCCIPSAPPVETEANELDRELTQQIINPTNNHP